MKINTVFLISIFNIIIMNNYNSVLKNNKKDEPLESSGLFALCVDNAARGLLSLYIQNLKDKFIRKFSNNNLFYLDYNPFLN